MATRRKSLAEREPSIRDLIDAGTVAVYVIAKGDAEVKIGLSKNVGTRAIGLQTSNSAELNIFWAGRLERVDAYRLEKHIHDDLRPTLNHIRGEWYAMAPETAVKVVKNAAKKLHLKIEPDLRFGGAV